MAEITWAKPKALPNPKPRQRLKFLLSGALILAAVLILLISGTMQGARYFISVDDLLSDPAYRGKTVRVSGAVDGETIDYDSENGVIRFDIVHIPGDYSDLARALRDALLDDSAARLAVVVEDVALPDLLQHEAQAILTGALKGDGFNASELLLKCPSRFEETSPEGLSAIPEHQ